MTRNIEPNLVRQVPSADCIGGSREGVPRAELRFESPPSGKSENIYLFDYQFVPCRRSQREQGPARKEQEENKKKDQPPETQTFSLRGYPVNVHPPPRRAFSVLFEYQASPRGGLSRSKSLGFGGRPPARRRQRLPQQEAVAPRRTIRASSGRTGTRRPSAGKERSSRKVTSTTKFGFKKKTACGSRAST